MEEVKPRRGRPKGSKNKPKEQNMSNGTGKKEDYNLFDPEDNGVTMNIIHVDVDPTVPIFDEAEETITEEDIKAVPPDAVVSPEEEKSEKVNIEETLQSIVDGQNTLFSCVAVLSIRVEKISRIVEHLEDNITKGEGIANLFDTVLQDMYEITKRVEDKIASLASPTPSEKVNAIPDVPISGLQEAVRTNIKRWEGKFPLNESCPLQACVSGMLKALRAPKKVEEFPALSQVDENDVLSALGSLGYDVNRASNSLVRRK